MDIGIIVEDKCDIEVMNELTGKLVKSNLFSFKKNFKAHGCGKLKIKCASWAKILFERGCEHLIVLHDLDDKEEGSLRKELVNSVKGVGYKSFIVLIPVIEVEAWLLSDTNALKQVFKMTKTPKLSNIPERFIDPKKELRDVVKKNSKNIYVNTIHNKKIAEKISISKLKAKCPSFLAYPHFLKSIFE